MNRIEINVSGPTQCGKSIVLAAIDRALRDMGIQFRLSEELEQERNMGHPDKPEDWEMEMLSKSYVVLSETNSPRQKLTCWDRQVESNET
jgi:predicted AAA+ superfamily ATPase